MEIANLYTYRQRVLELSRMSLLKRELYCMAHSFLILAIFRFLNMLPSSHYGVTVCDDSSKVNQTPPE